MTRFDEAYTDYKEPALSYTRSLGRRDAEDIVATAFSALLARSVKLPEIENFKAYLFTTIRHEIQRRGKLDQRERLVEDKDMEELSPTWDIIAFPGDIADEVRRAFRSLPLSYRDVLFQVHIEQRKPASVAKDLGISPNATSALLYRAKKALKAAYEEFHNA